MVALNLRIVLFLNWCIWLVKCRKDKGPRFKFPTLCL